MTSDYLFPPNSKSHSSITNLDSHQILKLASYFQTLGFNSYQKNSEENKSCQELCMGLKNKFELTFILYTRYWNGIQLHFRGLNANQFYSLIKRKSIKWKNLTEFNRILSRFDI